MASATSCIAWRGGAVAPGARTRGAATPRTAPAPQRPSRARLAVYAVAAPAEQDVAAQRAALEAAAAAPAAGTSTSASSAAARTGRVVLESEDELRSTWEHRAWVLGGSGLMAATLAQGLAQVDGPADAAIAGLAALAAYFLADVGTAFYHWCAGGASQMSDWPQAALGRLWRSRRRRRERRHGRQPPGARRRQPPHADCLLRSPPPACALPQGRGQLRRRQHPGVWRPDCRFPGPPPAPLDHHGARALQQPSQGAQAAGHAGGKAAICVGDGRGRCCNSRSARPLLPSAAPCPRDPSADAPAPLAAPTRLLPRPQLFRPATFFAVGLAGGAAAGAPMWWDVWSSTFLFLCCMSQQFHAWSHMKKSELPGFVVALQVRAWWPAGGSRCAARWRSRVPRHAGCRGGGAAVPLRAPAHRRALLAPRRRRTRACSSRARTTARTTRPPSTPSALWAGGGSRRGGRGRALRQRQRGAAARRRQGCPAAAAPPTNQPRPAPAPPRSSAGTAS